MFQLENSLWWALLILSPVLAMYVAMSAYNAVCRSRRKEQLAARDAGYDDAYRSWRERVKVRQDLDSVFCPMPLAVGETCYHYVYQVAVHVPVGRRLPSGGDHGPVFDTDSGVSVGRGWSLFDYVGATGVYGKASLCVTDRQVCLKGVGVDLKIGLQDVRTVTAACSNILIGASSLERPVLIDDVNGQMIRDILHRLMDRLGLLDEAGLSD